MAVYDQPTTSYSDTNKRKQVISDIIDIIDPRDTPLLDRLGGLDGASSKFRFTGGKSTKVEWLMDSLPGLTGVLATATIASNASSATVTDASVFQKGHIVQMDLQTFWVSTVDTTNNTVGLVSIGGTGGVHTSAGAITIIGMARVEGAESDAIGLPQVSLGTNYTQIYHQEVKVSRTMQTYAEWGVSNEMEYQIKKAIPSQLRLIEKNMLLMANSAAGNGTTARISGGLPMFVTTNTVSGVTMTKASFENACSSAYKAGGGPTWIAPLSPTNFGKVRAFYENTNYLIIQRNDAQVGMPPVTIIRTPFGDVEPLLDRWAGDSDIFLVDPSRAGMLTYDAFSREPLAKTGDFEREEVVGEFCFCLKSETAHARLGGVS